MYLFKKKKSSARLDDPGSNMIKMSANLEIELLNKEFYLIG